jgi:hypothetical protein
MRELLHGGTLRGLERQTRNAGWPRNAPGSSTVWVVRYVPPARSVVRMIQRVPGGGNSIGTEVWAGVAEGAATAPARARTAIHRRALRMFATPLPPPIIN